MLFFLMDMMWVKLSLSIFEFWRSCNGPDFEARVSVNQHEFLNFDYDEHDDDHHELGHASFEL